MNRPARDSRHDDELPTLERASLELHGLAADILVENSVALLRRIATPLVQAVDLLDTSIQRAKFLYAEAERDDDADMLDEAMGNARHALMAVLTANRQLQLVSKGSARTR